MSTSDRPEKRSARSNCSGRQLHSQARQQAQAVVAFEEGNYYARAGHRRVWKMMGTVAGAVVGLVGYAALMTFLTLLAAGMSV